MSTVQELIQSAFDRLASQPGFVTRSDQTQLANLIGDLIDEQKCGAFEAPTGLGKSLAALIPAIAHAVANQKRTVIATYTNVLAEQYWRKDLPLALSLFDVEPKCQFLIGRQRYACLLAMDEVAPELTDGFQHFAELGIESEFRSWCTKPAREVSQIWSKIIAPPICQGKFCVAYQPCFYYDARRKAETADIVITNHSVVIQHAAMCAALGDDDGLLGKFDFLILDEAHDFPQAAANGLEFELSPQKLSAVLGIANRLEQTVAPYAQRLGEMTPWMELCESFREGIAAAQKSLVTYNLELGRPGILTAAPTVVWDHPQVQASKTPDDTAAARRLAYEVSETCESLVAGLEDRIARWKEDEPESVRGLKESSHNFAIYIREFAQGCGSLFSPHGVAVSYANQSGQDSLMRQDIIDLAGPLTEMLWSKTPYVCLSATLALDGSFDYFRRVTGIEPDFEESLPTPFDFGSNAALYLPPSGRIPDPTIARRQGMEGQYFQAVATELSNILKLMNGRTLALFHSRREMEEVLARMDVPPELPIHVQTRSGVTTVGERFRKNVHASLFALRSFWTGFDAPGETLSCVVLVRVPFEVPVDPPQIARMAFLESKGLNPFAAHTLPQAKMLMRQGAGRLIRRAEDKGIIALLDSRLRSKRYGEEILNNLPPEMRRFDDLADAIGWVGIDVS